MPRYLGALAALALLGSAGSVAAQQSGQASDQQGPPKVDCPAGQQRIGTGVCATSIGPGAAGGAAGAMGGPTSGAAGTIGANAADNSGQAAPNQSTTSKSGQ